MRACSGYYADMWPGVGGPLALVALTVSYMAVHTGSSGLDVLLYVGAEGVDKAATFILTSDDPSSQVIIARFSLGLNGVKTVVDLLESLL